MIYRMAKEVESALRARSFPVRVEYGPDRSPLEIYDTRIVVSRDRQAGDSFDTPRGARVNPRGRATQTQGVSVLVYACSTLPGAGVHDHEFVCDQYVAAFVVTFLEWLVDAHTVGGVTSGRYLSGEERGDVETWPGVVYQLQLSVSRSVDTRAYVAQDDPGAARPTATIFAVTGRTDVTLEGVEGDPEVSCGG